MEEGRALGRVFVLARDRSLVASWYWGPGRALGAGLPCWMGPPLCLPGVSCGGSWSVCRAWILWWGWRASTPGVWLSVAWAWRSAGR